MESGTRLTADRAAAPESEGEPGLVREIEQCTALLERVLEDRTLLALIPHELRNRLYAAAGRVAKPSRLAQRQLVRAIRKQERKRVRNHDEALLANTGIRKLRQEQLFPTPSPVPWLAAPKPPAEEPELIEPGCCYVCKEEFRKVHFFYDQMCPGCAEENWEKRNQTVDLSGRVALLTGGRVKIGYQTGIKLLRAGCRLVVTTRFPRDAARRYAEEADAADWSDRLHIVGLDMRHTPTVEKFASELAGSLDRLDFILNNACQTVRRPPAFYAHLMDAERIPLSGNAEALVRSGASLSAELSQVALLPEDSTDLHLFPSGALDCDQQQVDLRTRNSWRLPLAEVSTVEFLETYLVNAVAPFILNARLKGLMLRDRTLDKHIVNVSAVEGQFYRSFKTDKHPHTNMAKAALNMMTRTSAADYARDGIFMNSVDTGWVTDEDPVEIAERKAEEHRFSPPLDIVDGAARIVDPIFSGFLTGKHVWGQFLKDYKPTDW